MGEAAAAAHARHTMRSIGPRALLLLTTVSVACGGEAPEGGATAAPPPALAPPPWLGPWPLGYGLDLRPALQVPDAAPEAHPFRGLWPAELGWLRPVAEPILEAWLRAELTEGLSAFFDEVEALPRRLADAELEATLRLQPDGGVEEVWSGLSIPDACDGAGLQVELDPIRSIEGRWWLDGDRLRIERRLRFRSEAATGALLDGLARCSGGAGVDALLDQSLDCAFDAFGSDVREVGRLLCSALRERWREKYTPRGEVHEWVLHQGVEPGPLDGGGEDVLVTGEEESRPAIRSWRLR